MLRVPAPVAGEMLQELGFTPWFAGSPVTVAVITLAPPAGTGVADATRVTAIVVDTLISTLITLEADFVGLATDVAVIVTVTVLASGAPGAV